MARLTYTSAAFYLSLPIDEFFACMEELQRMKQ
jgi:hypothetical protein